MLSFYLRATWSPAYSWLGSRQPGLSSPAPLSPEDRPPQSQVSYFPQKVLSQGWLVPRGGLAQASRGAHGPHTSCLACLTHTHTHQQGTPATAESWGVGDAALSPRLEAPGPAPPSGQDNLGLHRCQRPEAWWLAPAWHRSPSLQVSSEDHQLVGPGHRHLVTRRPTGTSQVLAPPHPTLIPMDPPRWGFALGQRFPALWESYPYP